AKTARKPSDLFTQFCVGERADRLRDRTVVDERTLLATPAGDVTVDGVVARVQDAAGEPSEERCARVVENVVPPPDPRDPASGFRPECLWLIQRALIGLAEIAHDALMIHTLSESGR